MIWWQRPLSWGVDGSLIGQSLHPFPFLTNEGGYVPSDGQFWYRFTHASDVIMVITRKRCSHVHNAFDGDPFCTSHPKALPQIFLILRFISAPCLRDTRRHPSSPSTFTSGLEVKCTFEIFLIARVQDLFDLFRGRTAFLLLLALSMKWTDGGITIRPSGPAAGFVEDTSFNLTCFSSRPVNVTWALPVQSSDELDNIQSKVYTKTDWISWFHL